jgi:hypothetical protein
MIQYNNKIILLLNLQRVMGLKYRLCLTWMLVIGSGLWVQVNAIMCRRGENTRYAICEELEICAECS